MWVDTETTYLWGVVVLVVSWGEWEWGWGPDSWRSLEKVRDQGGDILKNQGSWSKAPNQVSGDTCMAIPAPRPPLLAL